MTQTFIENRTFSELKLGDQASLTRVVTLKDIELFAMMSGDVNPIHLDPEFAKQSIFQKIIVQGMWGASLFSTILGTQLPGPGTIYLNQSLKFKHPIFPQDTITATLKVIEIPNPEKHIVDLECKCLNQMGKELITGIATVIAPTEKVKLKPIEISKLPNIFGILDNNK